jgi:hypothetical protein
VRMSQRCQKATSLGLMRKGPPIEVVYLGA